MSESYTNTKKPNFENEMNSFFEVFSKMKENGLLEKTQTNVDFIFTSNDKKKLSKLLDTLKSEFTVKVYHQKKLHFFKSECELSIELQDIIMEEGLLIYLMNHLFELAIEHDCVLGDWGAFIANNPVDYKSQSVKELIQLGYASYDKKLKFRSYHYFFVAAEGYNSAEAFYNLGNLKYESRFVKGSIRSLTKSIELMPENPLPYLNRGVAYYDLGDYELAIADYAKVMELDSENTDPYINTGNAYIKLKEREKAIAAYDKAIEMGCEQAEKIKKRGLQALQL